MIKNYRIEQNGNDSILVVYLESDSVEFSKEYFNKLGESVNSVKEDVQNLLNTQLKNTKVTACKIMLGSILLAAIPAAELTAQASTPSEQISYTQYIVKSGDTLWKISNNLGVSINDIKNTNNLTSDTIYTNQKLSIPYTQNNITYTVKSGDTLYKIAISQNSTVDSIKKANSLTSDIIYPGQTLVINKASQSINDSYVVKSGDTLWKIASSNDISINTIKELNNLSSDTIYVGQVLKLKGSVMNEEPIEDPAEPSNEYKIIYETYTVKSGDNQWSVAIDHGIPLTEFQQVNGFTDNTALSIGQDVKIPVHVVPVMETKGERYGEYLDWWDGAQYVFATNKIAKVTDFETGKTFNVKRTIGANHADCEPVTSNDTQIAKGIWGGFTWKTRAIIVEVDGRKIAGSMSFMPHGIQYIDGNNFNGHFDIHFLNSTRHKDGLIDNYHQDMIRVAAGIDG
jgi:LysM repeat protein